MGDRASTLRTATLALCFSVAKYCAPIWCRSTRTKLVDSHISSAMRMISGSVMSTPVQWLPVLSNIAPAYLLRNSASVKILDKIRLHLNLPVQVFKDIYEPPEFRLPSRRPIWSTMPSSDCSVDDAWREDWFKHDVPNQFLITDPTIRRPGSDLNRL